MSLCVSSIHITDHAIKVFVKKDNKEFEPFPCHYWTFGQYNIWIPSDFVIFFENYLSLFPGFYVYFFLPDNYGDSQIIFSELIKEGGFDD